MNKCWREKERIRGFSTGSSKGVQHNIIKNEFENLENFQFLEILQVTEFSERQMKEIVGQFMCKYGALVTCL